MFQAEGADNIDLILYLVTDDFRLQGLGYLLGTTHITGASQAKIDGEHMICPLGAFCPGYRAKSL
jgi:hypothetical protein